MQLAIFRRQRDCVVEVACRAVGVVLRGAPACQANQHGNRARRVEWQALQRRAEHGGADPVRAGVELLERQQERRLDVARAELEERLEVGDRRSPLAAGRVAARRDPVRVRPVRVLGERALGQVSGAFGVAGTVCEPGRSGRVVAPFVGERSLVLIHDAGQIHSERCERAVAVVVEERIPSEHQPVAEQPRA